MKEDAAVQKAAVVKYLDKELLSRSSISGRFAVIDVNQSVSANFPKALFNRLARAFRGRADYLIVPISRRNLPPSLLRQHAHWHTVWHNLGQTGERTGK